MGDFNQTADFFEVIRELQRQLGALERASPPMRYGSATLHWSAGQIFADSLTVVHSLGSTPTVIHLTPLWTAFTARDYVRLQARGVTSSDFIITGSTGDDVAYAGATDRTVYWVAIA